MTFAAQEIGSNTSVAMRKDGRFEITCFQLSRNENANSNLSPGVINLLRHSSDDSLLAPIESATFQFPAFNAVAHHFCIWSSLKWGKSSLISSSPFWPQARSLERCFYPCMHCYQLWGYGVSIFFLIGWFMVSMDWQLLSELKAQMVRGLSVDTVSNMVWMWGHSQIMKQITAIITVEQIRLDSDACRGRILKMFLYQILNFKHQGLYFYCVK